MICILPNHAFLGRDTTSNVYSLIKGSQKYIRNQTFQRNVLLFNKETANPDNITLQTVKNILYVAKGNVKLNIVAL